MLIDKKDSDVSSFRELLESRLNCRYLSLWVCIVRFALIKMKKDSHTCVDHKKVLLLLLIDMSDPSQQQSRYRVLCGVRLVDRIIEPSLNTHLIANDSEQCTVLGCRHDQKRGTATRSVPAEISESKVSHLFFAVHALAELPSDALVSDSTYPLFLQHPSLHVTPTSTSFTSRY
jgi:hypothetical protein